MPKRNKARSPYLVEQELKAEIKWIKDTFKFKHAELIDERLEVWRNYDDKMRRDVALRFHY